VTSPFEVNGKKLIGVRASKWVFSTSSLEYLLHRHSSWLSARSCACTAVGSFQPIAFFRDLTLPEQAYLFHCSVLLSAFLNQSYPHLL